MLHVGKEVFCKTIAQLNNLGKSKESLSKSLRLSYGRFLVYSISWLVSFFEHFDISCLCKVEWIECRLTLETFIIIYAVVLENISIRWIAKFINVSKLLILSTKFEVPTYNTKKCVLEMWCDTQRLFILDSNRT